MLFLLLLALATFVCSCVLLFLLESVFVGLLFAVLVGWLTVLAGFVLATVVASFSLFCIQGLIVVVVVVTVVTFSVFV